MRITPELIKKKSEHNEDGLPHLEEIALHQLQIEKIEVIGKLCRNIKILLLQDNLIEKIEGLHLCRNLHTLNLSLNNIHKIEGLEQCESLRKLDLMLCFIGVQTFRQSIANLRKNLLLKDLQLLGNPCMDWSGSNHLVIHQLSSLEYFNNARILPSDKIEANQRYALVSKQLDDLENSNQEITDSYNKDSDLTSHTPETRRELGREAEQLRTQKEEQEKLRHPKKRDYFLEHHQKIKAAEEDIYFQNGRVKQCNQGQYEYVLEEEFGNITLTVNLPKYLDSSLIHVDLKSDYVSVVVKNKLLRLSHPVPIATEDSTCQRSSATGKLRIIMKKENKDSITYVSKNIKKNIRPEKNNRLPHSKISRMHQAVLATIN